jgi:hypothetical protein
VPPDAYWTAARSATWIVVHDAQSSSYGNYIRDILAVGAVFIFIAAKDIDRPIGEGMGATILRWLKALWGKAGGVGLIVFVLFTFCQWVYNFSLARKVFVTQPPRVDVSWRLNDGFEVQRGVGTTITPKFMDEHRQYVAVINYPTVTPMVSPSVDVIFEFPYFVSSWSITADGSAPGTFMPVFNTQLTIFRGKGSITLTQQSYRTWNLHVPVINAGGYVRLVVTLDIAHEAEDSHDALDDYIHTTSAFSYGGRSTNVQTYAPFGVGVDKIVKLKGFLPVPKNLRVESYMY